jgi:hypothetical protein
VPPTLTREDIISEAQKWGLPPATLRAIILTESAGGGFLPSGQVKILYERHWMWRRLRARSMDPMPLARSRPDLCGPHWDKQYYRAGAREYDRLAEVVAWASQHDPDHWESYKKASFEACSWGLGQVMGFHFDTQGFADIYAFKHFNEESEKNQLEVMLRFCRDNRLIHALRGNDWEAIALTYNGPGQKAHYAEILEHNHLHAQHEGY